MKMDVSTIARNDGMGRTREPGGVAAIDKALDILEAFTASTPEHGVASLARQLGLPKPTVHRLLLTLSRRGYVVSSGGVYRLGTRVLDLGNSLLGSLDLLHLARPHLIRLRDDTNETVHLGIIEGDQTVYLDKVDSLQSVRMHTWIGRRACVHCTAIGKAILANLGEGRIREYLSRPQLEQMTSKSRVRPEDLLHDFEQIRLRGFAVDDEEATEGIRCAAAPIRDHLGRVIAALGVAGPVARLSTERLEQVGQTVVLAAESISAQLGFTGEGRPTSAADSSSQQRRTPNLSTM